MRDRTPLTPCFHQRRITLVKATHEATDGRIPEPEEIPSVADSTENLSDIDPLKSPTPLYGTVPIRPFSFDRRLTSLIPVPERPKCP